MTDVDPTSCDHPRRPTTRPPCEPAPRVVLILMLFQAAGEALPVLKLLSATSHYEYLLVSSHTKTRPASPWPGSESVPAPTQDPVRLACSIHDTGPIAVMPSLPTLSCPPRSLEHLSDCILTPLYLHSHTHVPVRMYVRRRRRHGPCSLRNQVPP